MSFTWICSTCRRDIVDKKGVVVKFLAQPNEQMVFCFQCFSVFCYKAYQTDNDKNIQEKLNVLLRNRTPDSVNTGLLNG